MKFGHDADMHTVPGSHGYQVDPGTGGIAFDDITGRPLTNDDGLIIGRGDVDGIPQSYRMSGETFQRLIGYHGPVKPTGIAYV